MKERKSWVYIKLWKLIVEFGSWQWKLALGYEGSRRWPDRYFYFTVGFFYMRLWLTGETR